MSLVRSLLPCLFAALVSAPMLAGAAEPIWPLSGRSEPDADRISQPYGPRWIGRYDFHAGVDLPAPTGTPILSILPGTVVQVRPWDGVTIGPGNAVLIDHGDGRFGSYLHLDMIGVEVGQQLEQGAIIGTVGETGARSPHLHFGLMIDLPRDSVDERRSRNPLELLPHTSPGQLPPAEFEGEHAVALRVPLQHMTIRSITLSGGDQERELDYYAVVAKGFNPRKEQEQDGFHLHVDPAVEGYFTLKLTLLEPQFAIERVQVRDIHDNVILDQPIPEPAALAPAALAGLLLRRRGGHR
jgi:murein DD-endopeptidase MepM/ murein hydrolase activator NlpD